MGRTPKIRFQGFTDDWEERKLGEVVVEFKETVDSDCDLPILTSSKNDGVLLQEEHFGNKQKHDITGYNVLPRNYCTYRNRSDGIAFTFNINRCCDRGIISKFYPVFYGNKNDTFFISLSLNNDVEVVREIGYTCSGTGQKVLSFSNLLKMILRIPKLEEQQKIGTYFSHLDSLIALQQRKVDESKELKKFMLQKMFPKEGEKVPEIRFPGFTDDWEERKLGEVCDFSKGIGYTKSDLVESGTPIILYGRLYTKYETVISDVDTFVNAKEKSFYSRGGEVIVPSSGETSEGISIASVVQKSGILLGGDLNILTPSAKLESIFLALNISFGKAHKELSKMAQGKSVVHLHNSDLEKIKILAPSFKEQCWISRSFSHLDSFIALQQRRFFCDLILKNLLKKAILQQFSIHENPKY